MTTIKQSTPSNAPSFSNPSVHAEDSVVAPPTSQNSRPLQTNVFEKAPDFSSVSAGRTHGTQAVEKTSSSALVTEITIHATPEEVWATLTGDGNFAKMFSDGAFPVPGVTKTERTGEFSDERGFVAGNGHYAVLPKPVGFGVDRTKETYTEVIPNELLRYTVENYPAPFNQVVKSGAATIELIPEGETTKIVFSYDFEQVQQEGWLADKASDTALGLAQWRWEANMQGALKNLKGMTESASNENPIIGH